MPADRKDLERRIAASKPSDTSRGVNYNSAFRLLADLLGPDAPKRADPLGTGTRVDFFTYPISEYLQLAWSAADALEAQVGGVDAAFFRLGERTVLDHVPTIMVKTLLTLFGKDPRRLLNNIPSVYSITVSYGTRTVEWLGEKHARLVYKGDFLVPAFHCGVLSAGVGAMGGKNAKAVGRELALLESEYEVTWE